MNFDTKFTKYGEQFELVESQDIFAIYKRSKGATASYETVIFYVNKHGKWYYPASTSWGQRGWSYPTYEEAKARYENVITTKQKLVSAAR